MPDVSRDENSRTGNPTDDVGGTGTGGGAGGRCVPFPGVSFFRPGRRSPIIAAMHDRLVAEGCDGYALQAGEPRKPKDVWGPGDERSFAMWHRKIGISAPADPPDGIPREDSWNRLCVPLT
ncbi:MAG: peptidoglycan-binding protein [Actinomycetota bacterium]|nr:peptidoglycan-binding protein [Actinomycetota bacterium]